MEILIKTIETNDILYIFLYIYKKGVEKSFSWPYIFWGIQIHVIVTSAQKNNKKKKHNYKIIIFSFFFFFNEHLQAFRQTVHLLFVRRFCSSVWKKTKTKPMLLLLQPFITTTCFNKYLVRLSLKLTEVLSFLCVCVCVCQLWGQRHYNPLSCPSSCVSSQPPHCIHVTTEEREAALFKVYFCFSLGGDIGCFWLHL